MKGKQSNNIYVKMHGYRYVMLSGYSGFYAYAIFERLEGWPAVELGQIRIVYKLRQDKYVY